MTDAASVLVCSGCGCRVPAAAPLALSCPDARPGDDVDHVLLPPLPAPGTAAPADAAADNPFLRWRARSWTYARARARGWSDADYVALVADLDAAVTRVDGRGFTVTPFRRADALSDTLGFHGGSGVWVKDETGSVAGSHKARHLFGTAVALAVEGVAAARPLAIASCGNAALAAAVVARAAGRPLAVYLPPDADPVVRQRLDELGATCTVCERTPGTVGDPTYQALLAAVADGAVPFTCQGNLNGPAVAAGETLGWELVVGRRRPRGSAPPGPRGGPGRRWRAAVRGRPRPGGRPRPAAAAGRGAADRRPPPGARGDPAAGPGRRRGGTVAGARRRQPAPIVGHVAVGGRARQRRPRHPR